MCRVFHCAPIPPRLLGHYYSAVRTEWIGPQWADRLSSGWANVQPNNYWSGTTNANNTSNAWIVNMNNGNVNNNNKGNSNYVWPVRGGEWNAAAPHLFDFTPPLTPDLSLKGRGGQAEKKSQKRLEVPDCSPPSRGGDEGAGDLFSFRNLYRNYIKCRRNKRNTINALKFEADAEANLFSLAEELHTGTYRPSRSICFVVDRPKMREIIAADFRDRVVHHLLVEQLEKIYEPIFIHDSYACRENKGVHKAIARVRDFIRQGSANGNRTLYFAHLDIKNFFMSIDKTVLYEMIEKKVRKSKGFCHANLSGSIPEGFPLCWNDMTTLSDLDALLRLTHTIIHHNPTENCIIKGKRELIPHLPPHKSMFHAAPGKGLPIGNLTSQFFANVYLNALDQYAKHTLKCRYYVRYCDDFLVLDESSERLEQVKEALRSFVERELLLELNPKHGAVTPVSNGIDFLGYIIRKDYTLVRRRVINNLKKRLDWFERRLVRHLPDQTTPVCGHPSLTSAGSRGDNESVGGIPSYRESFRKKDPEHVGVTERARLVRFDYPLIEKLRAVLASYWGHMKWANTNKLRAAILRRYGFLQEIFHQRSPLWQKGSGGVTAIDCGRFNISGKQRCDFSAVRNQYRYYAAQFRDSAVFFQVGRYYEIYDYAGWAEDLGLNRLPENRRGVMYGFHVSLAEAKARDLLSSGLPVVFVRETGNYMGRLKERRPVMKMIKGVLNA